MLDDTLCHSSTDRSHRNGLVGERKAASGFVVRETRLAALPSGPRASGSLLLYCNAPVPQCIEPSMFLSECAFYFSIQWSQIPKKHTDEHKKAFFGGKTWDSGTFTLAYPTHQPRPDLCMGRRPLCGTAGPKFKKLFSRDFTFWNFESERDIL